MLHFVYFTNKLFIDLYLFFGFLGQLAIKSTSVLLVGCGGLGCPVAIYLAAAGIGELFKSVHNARQILNLVLFVLLILLLANA